MPPIVTAFPPSVKVTAASFFTVSVVIIASAASVPPSFEMLFARAAILFSIGSIGRICPITPVEATITSFSSMPSASAARAHIFSAFKAPSKLQVLALPLFAITALAVPFSRCFFVTSIVEDLTRFFVKIAAALHGTSQ